MFISEIFHSIQGEGELTGVSSVFVRLSGCNLRCGWCDTKYASWEPEGETLEVAEVLQRVGAFPARHVVLTGGEPMIAADIHELASALRERGYHLTIETAGTVPPGGIACDLASLSPKLSHSTPARGEIEPAWIERHEARRLQPDVLRAWIEGYAFQLKFVVAGPPDLEEIGALLAQLPEVPPHRVLLMPEGVTREALEAGREAVIELCRIHGYRFCDRLHIHLYGNTPGT